MFADDTTFGQVTRFATRAPAAIHDADALFALEDGPGDPLHLQITLGGGSGTAAVLLLPLAGLVSLRRRA